LSGTGLCDELITRPEESYRLCCVVVCDLETSRIGAPYIYDISNLRVKEISVMVVMIMMMVMVRFSPNSHCVCFQYRHLYPHLYVNIELLYPDLVFLP